MWPWPESCPIHTRPQMQCVIRRSCHNWKGKKKREKLKERNVLYMLSIFLPYFYDAYWHNITMLINMIYLVVVLMLIFKNHAILYKTVCCLCSLCSYKPLCFHCERGHLLSTEIMNDCMCSVWSRVESVKRFKCMWPRMLNKDMWPDVWV